MIRLRSIVRENIRAYRVLAKLTQGEVSRRVEDFGVPTFSRQALSSIERGHREVSLIEAAAIASVLDTTIPKLLDEFGPGAVAVASVAWHGGYLQPGWTTGHHR